jgi:hypothetical protein
MEKMSMSVSVEDVTESLGWRLKDELKKKYPAHTAKQVARVTGAELRTARSWVEEAKVPQEHHLRAIVRELGRDALLALFQPEIETHEQKLEREIHELREEIARREARIEKSRAQAPLEMAPAQAPGSPDRRVNHGERRSGYGPDGRQHRRRADDR